MDNVIIHQEKQKNPNVSMSVAVGYLENPLDPLAPRTTTLDPRPSTFDPRLNFFDRSNYKIRETISGQCWLTDCDAGLTLTERLMYVLGSGTYAILIRLYIDCHLSTTTVLH